MGDEVETIGIVKALFAFVEPSTYRELLASVGMPRVVAGASSSAVKVNIICTFTNVGTMLLDDIGGVQSQYDSYSRQNNLKAYEVIFNLLLGLYSCYGEALGLFSETCAKGRTALQRD